LGLERFHTASVDLSRSRVSQWGQQQTPDCASRFAPKRLFLGREAALAGGGFISWCGRARAQCGQSRSLLAGFSPATTFFRYRVLLGHRARIVKKGRVLSDAEYTSWQFQTRARRQLPASSAPLTSSRAGQASFRVDLACGAVEATSTSAATPGDQRRLDSQSTPFWLSRSVKRQARRRANLLAFRRQNSSKSGVSYFVFWIAGRGGFGGKALWS
jgi:hypothetical protein